MNLEIYGPGPRAGWTRFRKTYRTYKVPGATKNADPKFMGRITRVTNKRDLWSAQVWETEPPTRGMTWVTKAKGTHDEMMKLVEGLAVERVLEREAVGT